MPGEKNDPRPKSSPTATSGGLQGLQHETRLRVRYPETDPQGVVHHAVFLHYFEVGRTELLRALGMPYAELEKQGLFLMVTECHLRFLSPAHYDDLLIVRTSVVRVSRVRIYLDYHVTQEETEIAVCVGSTTLAAVTSSGRPCALPGRFTEV